jgi:hypothetical protein
VTIRAFLYRAEILLWIALTVFFLAIWVLFAGPQMHVAETTIGLAAAIIGFGLLFLGSRRRLKRRDFAAKELEQAADEACRRAEELAQMEWEAAQQAKISADLARAERARQQSDETTHSKRRKLDMRALVDDLLSGLTSEERLALQIWLEELLVIRRYAGSNRQKMRLLLAALKKSQSIAPIAKTLFFKLKKHGWDGLGGVTKWAVGSAAVALFAFGGAGAGIAAFGGAIGIPLFIVFGAGGALAGTIIQEIDRRNSK